MQFSARPLLLMHDAPGLAGSLREAAGDDGRVWTLSDWDALERAMERVPPTAVVIVDPYAGSPSEPSPRLHALLQGLPSATVVAALPVTAQTVPHLETLARWGVADVVELGREDTPAALAACAAPIPAPATAAETGAQTNTGQGQLGGGTK